MDQIEEIKAKTDIVALISEYLPLKKSGRNFKALCPFHQEKTPSFVVSPELQIFKCFGCGAAGDAIKFLQLYEKMDFGEALEFLAERAGVKLVRRWSGREERLKKRLYQINHLAAEFYHFLLTKHPLGKPVLAYLSERGIKPATIRAFQLGFSPLRDEAVGEFLRRKGYAPEEALKAGLLVRRQRGGYSDRFRGRLVFPLFDHRGNPVGFSGRIVPGLSPPQAPKYINSPETPVYHKGANLYGLWLTRQEIRRKNEVIAVEGEFDLLSPYQAGITNIVAVKGTAFTADQARLLRRFSENLILALDADEAGIEAAKKSAQVAELVGLNLKIAALPSGYKDPDELARKNPAKLKEVLAHPVLIWDFVMENALKKHSPSRPLGKKAVVNEVLPFLARIENAVMRNHYLRLLAHRLEIDLAALLAELEKMGQNRSSASPASPSSLEEERDRREVLEQYLLSLIFSCGHRRWWRDHSWLSRLKTPRFRRIADLAQRFWQEKKGATVSAFFASLPDELKVSFESIYLYEGKNVAEEAVDQEIAKTIKELTKLDLQEKLHSLARDIAQAERERRRRRLSRLEKEFVSLSRKLVALEEANSEML